MQCNLSGMQVGYSFSNKLSAFATVFYRRRHTSTFGEKENSGKILHSEFTREANLGLSYYKQQGNLIYEFMAGVGAGSLRYKMQEDMYAGYQFNLHAHKAIAFLQPNIGINIHDKFEFGLYTRLGLYRYFILDSDFQEGIRSADPANLTLLGKETANFVFVEPGVMARLGGENIKCQFALFPSLNLSNEQIRHKQLNVSIGFFFNGVLGDQKTPIN